MGVLLRRIFESHLKQKSNHLSESSTSSQLERSPTSQVEYVAVATAVKQGSHRGSLGGKNYFMWG